MVTTGPGGNKHWVVSKIKESRGADLANMSAAGAFKVPTVRYASDKGFAGLLTK
jgi:hypothetical protein